MKKGRGYWLETASSGAKFEKWSKYDETQSYHFRAYHSFGNSYSYITSVKWDAYDEENTAGKARRYRIDSKNSSLFHLGDNNNNVGRPVSHSLLCRLFFFFASRERAMGACLRDFSLRPKEKKTRKNKQTNKNKGVSQQFSDLIDSCGTRTIGPGYLKSLWQLSPLVPICNGLKQEGIGREIIHFAGPKTFSQKLCFPRFYCLLRQSILVFFTA